jgi:hypothetical protein
LSRKRLEDYQFTEEQIDLLVRFSADDLVGTEEFEGIPRRILREKRKDLLEEFDTSKTKFRQSTQGATASGKSVGRVMTLDDLLAKCDVDLEEWYVERHEVNKWETARKDIQKDIRYRVGQKDKHGSETTITEGYASDSGEMNVQELYQVKAWLRRRKPAGFDSKKFRAELIEDAKSFYTGTRSKLQPLIISPDRLPQSNMLLINIFDMHYDKLAWHEESGVDFDAKIGKRIIREAVDNLLSHASHYNIDEIWFPIGNDFFNSDKAYPYSATTKGTPQQSDGRWQKIFREGRTLLGEIIQELSQIADVKVPVIPGNHDYERVFYLGDSLECFFYNHGNVEVINLSDDHNYPRKYLKFHDNLIGFTHGNNEKANELHEIMSMESPDWSSSRFKYMYLGHFHHEKHIKFISTQDFKGLHIEYLPSLTAPDGWHHQKGFIGSQRGAKAYIHNAKYGRIGSFSHWQV